MGVVLYREPELESPILVASWPGIGNIGIIAVDTLRRALKAEELGEIEPWEFFYPKKVVIRDGVLKALEFPSSKFYFKRTHKRDLLFFIGEEQPDTEVKLYAEGAKAYNMANLVVDAALRFGCRRIYTSGAAVAPIHHTTNSRVWAVPNSSSLLKEMRGYQNVVLMSDIEGHGGQGNIAGLNGLLLGVAKKKGVEAICLMGEIPIYLHGFPIAYPKGSKAVVEVLSAILGVVIDMTELDSFVEQTGREIEAIYSKLPLEIREHLDKLISIERRGKAESGPITEEDKRKILQEIDKLFKKESNDD